MTHRLVPMLLALALALVGAPRAARAGTKAERADAKRAELAAKVKDGIRELGTGPDARISVRRRDGRKVEGFVASVDDATFTVAGDSGGTTQVPYDDVTKVKGHNLATGWKIAIGAAIAVGVVFVVLVVFLATNTR